MSIVRITQDLAQITKEVVEEVDLSEVRNDIEKYTNIKEKKLSEIAELEAEITKLQAKVTEVEAIPFEELPVEEEII